MRRTIRLAVPVIMRHYIKMLYIYAINKATAHIVCGQLPYYVLDEICCIFCGKVIQFKYQ